MNFDPYDINNFETTINDLIESAEKDETILITVYDTSKEYNLNVVNNYLKEHSNIILSYDRYFEKEKEHALYFSMR